MACNGNISTYVTKVNVNDNDDTEIESVLEGWVPILLKMFKKYKSVNKLCYIFNRWYYSYN